MQIVGLLETWMGKNDAVSIEGFASFSKPGTRRSNRGRLSGGVLVLVKEDWKEQVQLLDVGSTNLIWIKVNTGCSVVCVFFFFLACLSASDVGDQHGYSGFICCNSEQFFRAFLEPCSKVVEPGNSSSAGRSLSFYFSLQDTLKQLIPFLIPHDVAKIL